MADNNNQITGSPIVQGINNQTLAAGRPFLLEMSQFVLLRSGETVSYRIEDFPETFTIDEATGLLTGTAPNIELNEAYLVKFIVYSHLTQRETTVLFNLEIVGTILLGTPEAKAFFGLEFTPPTFWESAAEWEIRHFIQQLINEHFVWIGIMNTSNQEELRGKLISTRKALSGWMIYNYENMIVITPGDCAFEMYGNRGRLLQTLREVYSQDVIKKGWDAIELAGSDQENIGRAWLVAKQTSLAITPEAPTISARLNQINLDRIQQTFPPEKLRPLP